jgi:hypothetical protein
MEEKMFDSAVNYFQNRLDNQKLKMDDFKSLFLPIKSAVTARNKKKMDVLKSNPLSLKNSNNGLLKSGKNSSGFNTVNSNKSKENVSSRIIVNKDGTFRRINDDKNIKNVTLYGLKNKALMSILSGEHYYPPEFQLKPKFIEKTESIKQESLNDEINNVDLPLKDAPSYTIESNQLTFKVCDEEN